MNDFECACECARLTKRCERRTNGAWESVAKREDVVRVHENDVWGADRGVRRESGRVRKGVG